MPLTEKYFLPRHQRPTESQTTKPGRPKERALEAEKSQGSRISVGTQTEDFTVPGKDKGLSLSNGGLQQAEETSSTRGKSSQDSSNVGEVDLAEVLGGGGPFRVAKNSFGPLTETENMTSELQTVQENPEGHSASQFPSSMGLQEAQDVGEPPPDATKEKAPSSGQSRLGGPLPGLGSPSPEPPSEGSSVVQNVMATKKEFRSKDPTLSPATVTGDGTAVPTSTS
ncbi:hypothetical protein E2320_013955 [Naja naja]|nr:hypothetical protein E2320_013955 [Naja naja]